jgi:hypothetical protein
MRRATLVLALIFVSLFAACSGGDESVLRSGEPRFPSDAGVVTDATLTRIQLEGKRNYDIADEVESFKTRSHAITSLLAWEGKYVQLGLNEKKQVTWIAGIGTVLKVPQPVVYYSGVIDRVNRAKHWLYFDDGTVLQFDHRLKPPGKGTEVVCTIDPDVGIVAKVSAAA